MWSASVPTCSGWSSSGAEVISVEDGTATLKDAINECFRDWAFSMEDTHYVLGTACGPHPFPAMVARFVHVIGRESREQMLGKVRPPSRSRVCLRRRGLQRHRHVPRLCRRPRGSSWSGSRPAGWGSIQGNTPRAWPERTARPVWAQGYKTFFLQNEEGQMLDTHSVSAGLDYIGVSPILAHLHRSGRVRFEAATDEEVIAGLRRLMRSEGIVGALESTHAVAGALREAAGLRGDQIFLVQSLRPRRQGHFHDRRRSRGRKLEGVPQGEGLEAVSVFLRPVGLPARFAEPPP